MKKDYEILSHTADIKIRAYGSDLQELFCNAVIGMFQAIGPKIDGCSFVAGRVVCDKLPVERIVELSAIDAEVLLVNFLSQALYLSDINNEAYLNVRVHEFEEFEDLVLQKKDSVKEGEKTGVKICATLYGVKVLGFDVVEIKAVTYHDLNLEQIDGIWQTDIVFDI